MTRLISQTTKAEVQRAQRLWRGAWGVSRQGSSHLKAKQRESDAQRGRTEFVVRQCRLTRMWLNHCVVTNAA
jgi:hypothetical protein